MKPKTKLEASSILVIRNSDASRMEAKRHFDEHGIILNVHYLLFYDANKEFANVISTESKPQLIFTSHKEYDVFDSVKLARGIKAINPNAIVFALTSSHVRDGDDPSKGLDGVIENSFENSEMPHLVVKAYLAGKSRQKLAQMVRQK